MTLEPLDDWIVVEPLDETETPAGLIVPANEASQTRTALVAAVGPEVDSRNLRPRSRLGRVRLLETC